MTGTTGSNFPDKRILKQGELRDNPARAESHSAATHVKRGKENAAWKPL